MVTEQVITLPTEPTEGEIVKSHPLFSFINVGQRDRRRCILRNIFTNASRFIFGERDNM